MPGTKTIVLDDPATARDKAAAMLVEPAAFIYLWVFGDDATAQDLVTTGDELAGGDAETSDRRVVAAKTLTASDPMFTALRRWSQIQPIPASQIKALSTSGKLTVAQEMTSQQTGDAWVSTAYIAAEGCDANP